MIKLYLLCCLYSQFDLQQAVNSAIEVTPSGPKGGIVFVPPGTHTLTQTLKIPSNIGLSIDGGSIGKTIIQWNGPTDQNMIEMSGCHHVEIKNIMLLCNSPCKYMVQLNRAIGDKFISTACTFDNVVFGDNRVVCERCVSMSVGTSGDANNELHRFRRCEFSGYSKYAVYVYGSQIHALVFEDCGMFSGNNADYGVYTEYGTFFHWLRGSGGYHRIADFRLGKFYHVVNIDGWNSEGSKGLLHSDKADFNPAPITITNVRWEGDATNPIISMLHPGPLVINGNLFSSNMSRPRIRLSGLSGHKSGQAVVVGNSIYALGTYNDAAPFITKNADFALVYEGNNFFDYATGPSIGDQPIISNGYPVLSKSQDGIMTRLPQDLMANKNFLNTYNHATGLAIQSIHSDGRVSLGNMVGKGKLTFWNRQDRVDADGLWMFSNQTIGNGRTTYHATGAAAYTSNTNALHWIVPSISNENETITGVAMRYAATKQPSINLFAREVAIGTTFDTMPSTTFGAVKMRVTNEGIYFGTVRFTPTADGDIILNSAKFNNKKLSEFLAP